MPPESQEPEVETQNEETEIYDNRSYNLWISFNNCTITNLHIEQYGKPVNPPPKGGG
jgi:hypothetical protein